MRSPNPLRPQIASTHEKGLDLEDLAKKQNAFLSPIEYLKLPK
jgi:hypothetical protein